MQHISELVSKASPSGQVPRDDSSKPQSKSRMVNLWERMTHAFGHRWAATYGESAIRDGQMTDVAQTWAAGLAGLDGNSLAHGLRQCAQRGEAWPPSLPQFRALCEPTPESLGLPTETEAYREAVRARGQWKYHEWSHPAVYRAAKEVGTWALRELPDSKLRPLFNRAYAVMVRRVMKGESLEAPIPKALPKRVHRKSDKQKAATECRALFDRLAGKGAIRS